MNSSAVISLLCLDDPDGYHYWAGLDVARDELDYRKRICITSTTCRMLNKKSCWEEKLPRPLDRERNCCSSSRHQSYQKGRSSAYVSNLEKHLSMSLMM
jgi:hypothetical protein